MMMGMGLLLVVPAAVGQEATPRFALYFGDGVLSVDEVARYYDAAVWHNHPKLIQRIAQVKTRHPGFTALMYRELFCVLQQETPLEESVGGYPWIEAHHPEWFQRDVNGRRVEVPGYPGRWMMDLGHPGWQEFWIQQTLRDVIDGGWDGVFADDALTTVRAHDLPPLAGYPHDDALQQAVYAFLKKAHAAFRAAGKLLIANVSNGYDYPGLWERWLGVTDGLMEEHFAGQGWTWGEHVARRQLDAVRLADRMGKWALCLTYGSWDDRDRMRNSLAAYLVSAGSRTYWSYRPTGRSQPPMWNDAWAVQLGQPLEERQEYNGLWIRRFERGVAVVNPGPSTREFMWSGKSMTLGSHQGMWLQEEAAGDHDHGQRETD